LPLLEISTMVPLVALLCIALPLVAGAGHEGNDGHMDNNMMMQQMMQQLMQSWDWGHKQEPAQHWSAMDMNSHEDMEAFRKWCEERERQKREYEEQQRLMEMYEKQEKERKERLEKEKAEKEAKEKHEAMLAQWNTWQQQLTQVQHFDKIEYELMEMEHKYMYAVTCEVIKFCKCEDWIDDLSRYFDHDGFSATREDYDLSDFAFVDPDTPWATVAQQLYQRPAEDLSKAFFGGLANQLCHGAKKYLGDVMQWDMDRDFINKLM